MSKPGRVASPGPVQGESAARLGDIRHKGGVTLPQAFVWNVGTCRLDVKRDVQGRNPEGQRIEVPTAYASFPKEILHPPRAWAERVYNIQRWTLMPAGGHFAALEEPAALAADIRAFFRDLRQ